MASRRKKRKQAAADVDPLGGFSVDELLGLDLISEPEPKKQSLVGRVVSLPFKVVGAVLKLPFRILGLPLRLIRAILPSRNKED